MKKISLLSLIPYPLLLVALLAGCKKVETTRTNTVSDTTSQTTIAFDDLTVNNELDQFVDDAVKVFSDSNATIAGATVSYLSPKVFEIGYYGKDYYGSAPAGIKTRQGEDSIHLNGLPWGSPGATASLSFQDVSDPTGYEIQFYSIVTKANDSTSLTFIGGLTITNVSGGLFPTAPNDSLTVRIKATGVSYIFNDQAAIIQVFNFNVNCLRSYTMNDTVIYATTRGDTNINDSPNVENWGSDRLGSNYYSIITSPVVQNISDLYLSYNPLSGAKTIGGISQPIQALYGVNSQGATANNSTPYGISISWTNGALVSAVLPYYY